MDGLSRVVGIGPRVRLNGKEYQVRGKTNRFFAELEAELLKLRGDPLEMIVRAGKEAKLSNDMTLLTRVADVVAEKFRGWAVMTYMDYLEFMNTPIGDAFTAYHCLKQDAPEITLDEVRHYIVSMKFKALDVETVDGEEETADGKKVPIQKKVPTKEAISASEEIAVLFKAIEVASGEDQLGNLNGRVPATENPAAATTGT